MKDGEEGAVYPFKLDPVQLPPYEDGDESSSCVVVHTSPGEMPDSRREPTGRVQKVVLQTFQDLSGVAGQGVAIEEGLNQAASGLVYDHGPDPAHPKRDQRRTYAKRALDSLLEWGLLFIQGDQIFPYDPRAANVSKASNDTDEANGARLT